MIASEMHTCVTCRVVFKDIDIQREHYKTDWHRYNLKRKVAQLPSVTAEEFNNKVLQQRSLMEENNASKTQYCECCRKSFVNEKSYTNHLNSKRHQDNLLTNKPKTPQTTVSESQMETNKVEEVENKIVIENKMDKNEQVESKMETDEEDDEDVEEVDSDEWGEDEFAEKLCLFCAHQSRTYVRNLRHMSQAHSFFVPDVEYCVDLPGLLRYLGQKVREGFMCLWCNERGRTFYSAEAAQSHMLDKGHCKMLHEGLALAEYTDFYDYTSSYPVQEGETLDPDEEVEVEELDGSDFQLVLPSGAVVGHRSLMRYYRQRLSARPAGPGSVVPRGKDRRLHQVLAQYRAAGWSLAHQEAVTRRARDLHYMRRHQAKHHVQLGIKANKLQKHFRPQVNF